MPLFSLFPSISSLEALRAIKLRLAGILSEQNLESSREKLPSLSFSKEKDGKDARYLFSASENCGLGRTKIEIPMAKKTT